ncbi:hypothetical protein B0H15DRAFT_188270 [Mycena belliarum]|uniref:Uncharacterized protein n=1 Tax=Mycena belliarum TaxID=1033014 RepID=A0AAD6UL70_9AGAR|nr:hypothetical protein B0H15DRAFT_188270 [Mycena belliae]
MYKYSARRSFSNHHLVQHDHVCRWQDRAPQTARRPPRTRPRLPRALLPRPASIYLALVDRDTQGRRGAPLPAEPARERRTGGAKTKEAQLQALMTAFATPGTRPIEPTSAGAAPVEQQPILISPASYILTPPDDRTVLLRHLRCWTVTYHHFTVFLPYAPRPRKSLRYQLQIHAVFPLNPIPRRRASLQVSCVLLPVLRLPSLRASDKSRPRRRAILLPTPRLFSAAR